MNIIIPCGIEMLQGDFMHCYPVLYNGEEIGMATLAENGLYVDICCQCKFTKPDIYRISMKCEATEILLGVCVPKGSEYILNKKLPAKRIRNKNMKFFVLGGENNGRNIEGIQISKLRHMRFNTNEGFWELNTY